jgi:hypothetical protein
LVGGPQPKLFVFIRFNQSYWLRSVFLCLEKPYTEKYSRNGESSEEIFM